MSFYLMDDCCCQNCCRISYFYHCFGLNKMQSLLVAKRQYSICFF
uniref:Uncharacterized protein n=1 Tax=Arundo donax TaxID=35708 RepID=A0A0A9PXY5_ARUDO